MAAEYSFAGGQTVFYYLGGFEPELADEQPGWLSLAQAIKRAIEDGFRATTSCAATNRTRPRGARCPGRWCGCRVVGSQPTARLRFATSLGLRGDEGVGSERLVANQGLNAMPRWKRSLLNLYYHGSYPLRAGYRQLAASHRPDADRGAVLSSHRRRSGHAVDGLELRSSSGKFAGSSGNFDLVSLAEAQRRLRAGETTGPPWSITFDDGYADNCTLALPLLIEQRDSLHVLRLLAADRSRRAVSPRRGARAGRWRRTPRRRSARLAARRHRDRRAHPHARRPGPDRPTRDRLHDEIVVARDELEANGRRPVRYFAFPFGQHVEPESAGVSPGPRSRLRRRLLGLRRLQLSGRRPVSPAADPRRRRHDSLEELDHARSAQAAFDRALPLSDRRPRPRRAKFAGAGA